MLLHFLGTTFVETAVYSHEVLKMVEYIHVLGALCFHKNHRYQTEKPVHVIEVDCDSLVAATFDKPYRV